MREKNYLRFRGTEKAAEKLFCGNPGTRRPARSNAVEKSAEGRKAHFI